MGFILVVLLLIHCYLVLYALINCVVLLRFTDEKIIESFFFFRWLLCVIKLFLCETNCFSLEDKKDHGRGYDEMEFNKVVGRSFYES